MTNVVYLLIALLVCHYLADFCLTLPVMIRAKSDGRKLWPIVLHASIHAVLMGLCLLIYGVEWQMLLILMMIELVSHFVIDVSKARVSIRFPYLSDNRHNTLRKFSLFIFPEITWPFSSSKHRIWIEFAAKSFEKMFQLTLVSATIGP